MSLNKTPEITAEKLAANRANGRKSRGPITPEGKLRSSQNARKPSDRLLGPDGGEDAAL